MVVICLVGEITGKWSAMLSVTDAKLFDVGEDVMVVVTVALADRKNLDLDWLLGLRFYVWIGDYFEQGCFG